MDSGAVSKTKDVEMVEQIASAKKRIVDEIKKIIVGQEHIIDLLLISLFAKGHSLLVGVPGLAKTLIISSVAKVLNLKFNRIQFTPDLMPSDITGTEVLEEDRTTGKRIFKFLRGPIFTNILLADEINRTPPKTQAALLQAMQEYKVTVAGTTYEFESPFQVFATQNPIEQEGTYPLPEAQLDRFMFEIDIGYPSFAEEIVIMTTTTSAYSPSLMKVLGPEEIRTLQELVRRVPVADHVIAYAVRLVRSTRPEDESAPKFIKDWVKWGASPRATQHLILGGKARAILNGRYAVSIDDIKSLAIPVLKHRIIPNLRAETEGVSTEIILRKLLDTIE
jgi:MoxR-like ATPase